MQLQNPPTYTEVPKGKRRVKKKKIKMMTAIIWLKPAPFYLLPTVSQDELKTKYLLLSINRTNQSRVKAQEIRFK